MCYRKGDWLHISPGWLCYLSPEVIRCLHSGRSKVDLPFSEKSDVYAFGYAWWTYFKNINISTSRQKKKKKDWVKMKINYFVEYKNCSWGNVLVCGYISVALHLLQRPCFDIPVSSMWRRNLDQKNVPWIVVFKGTRIMKTAPTCINHEDCAYLYTLIADFRHFVVNVMDFLNLYQSSWQDGKFSRIFYLEYWHWWFCFYSIPS